ncbi:MAG: hypothetical protein ACKV2U_20010 [Bryobacteraceae bacterium]
MRTYFLNRLSNAARALLTVRDTCGPTGAAAITLGGAGGAVDSRATVTRELKSEHSLRLSLAAMRSVTGLAHWKCAEESKCAHCLQQCNSTAHLGQG